MDHKDCFGSLQQTTLDDGQTTTQSRPECRNCQEIRDCLRYTKQIADEKKEKEELRKQNWITEIIDHSFVVSNELGSCLLKFLNRIYSSSLGAILFKDLFLFFDVPQNSLSSNLSISITRTMMGLLRAEKEESNPPPNPQAAPSTAGTRRRIYSPDRPLSEIFSKFSGGEYGNDRLRSGSRACFRRSRGQTDPSGSLRF